MARMALLGSVNLKIPKRYNMPSPAFGLERVLLPNCAAPGALPHVPEHPLFLNIRCRTTNSVSSS